MFSNFTPSGSEPGHCPHGGITGYRFWLVERVQKVILHTTEKGNPISVALLLRDTTGKIDLPTAILILYFLLSVRVRHGQGQEHR